MADEHPLERLLRDAKEKDDIEAAVLVAEQRKALDLQEKVRLQWVRTKALLMAEIARANEVLEKHNLTERFIYRELPEPGSANIARCNLALGYPGKSPRAEYDLTVLSADGRMILLHRATAQRHQKLTVFTTSRQSWETAFIALYEDHLKKGRDTSPPSADTAPSAAAPTGVVAKKAS